MLSLNVDLLLSPAEAFALTTFYLNVMLFGVEYERLSCGTLVISAYHCDDDRIMSLFVVPFGVPRPNVGAFVASVYRKWWLSAVASGEAVADAKSTAARYRPCGIAYTTREGHLSTSEEAS